MDHVHIRNFKSLEDTHLNCGNLVAFIGENNSGKSNLLEALDLFFNPSTSKVGEETFFGRQTSRMIEITVEFKDLNEWEAKNFSPWLDGQKLRVKRVVQWGEPPEIRQTAIVKVPEPEWLREDLMNEVKIKEWWAKRQELLVGDLRFDNYLGTKRPTVNEWKNAVSSFLREQSERIPWVDEEQENPKGYAGVLKGGLPEFIPVPAVRNVLEEVKVGKANPFGRMVNTLLRRISSDRRNDITKAVEQIKRLINRTEGGGRIPEIKEIENRLKQMLCAFIECDIEIEVPLPDLESMFSGVRIFVDDGVRTSVEAKGHGLQRSVIFAILRAYAETIRRGETEEDEKDKSVIFAIEEPELYLHPQAQRTMMQVLRTIAQGRDQVLYSTHSSLFVDISYFDEICLMRREQIEGHWKSATTQLSMDAIIRDLKARFPSTSPTQDSMRERYSHVYSGTRSEGFFARKVVLVEGQTEEYAIPIYSRALEYDMDREGVSVISSGGKGQIDRLLQIFNEFRIPCYIIFDGDKSSKDPQIGKLTKELLEFVEWQGSYPPTTTVGEWFTVFEEEFEETMKKEVPQYASFVQEAKQTLGLKSETGDPLIARFMAKRLVEKGQREGNPSKYVPCTVAQIIEKVRTLEWKRSVLKPIALAGSTRVCVLAEFQPQDRKGSQHNMSVTSPNQSPEQLGM
jgi:predicted ATP-dependent endonuclease of OLD family